MGGWVAGGERRVGCSASAHLWLDLLLLLGEALVPQANERDELRPALRLLLLALEFQPAFGGFGARRHRRAL